MPVGGSYWRASKVSSLKTARYATAVGAVNAIAYHANERSSYRVVHDDGTVVWEGNKRLAREERDNDYPTPKEMKMDLISDLPVINVDREQFLEALQPKLEAEQAKREAADAERRERLADYQAAVEDFSNEELVRILRNYWTEDTATLISNKKSGTWEPKEIAPSQEETDLARAVRVLSLSSDKTIELKPGTNLYNLL